MAIISVSPSAVQSCPDVSQIQHAADRLAYHNDGGHFEDYVPGWDADRYEPSPDTAAQEAGWRRGYDLDRAAQPPSDMEATLKACWEAGKAEGLRDRRFDDSEFAAYEADLQEWTTRDRGEIDIDEVIRAIGCLAARLEGGAL